VDAGKGPYSNQQCTVIRFTSKDLRKSADLRKAAV
jgi:hypothetical protein